MKRLTIPMVLIVRFITGRRSLPCGVWDVLKWGLLATIFVGFATLCPAQRKSRTAPLRVIQLPPPNFTGTVSIEEVLAKRRSIRAFTGQPLNFTQISQLAWAGQGITEKENGLRTAPSAGAIYPINLYFAIQGGVFLYNPFEHSLEQTLDRDVQIRLATAALNQEVVAEAACNIIVAGSTRKLVDKYRNKAKRYMLLEAGHIAQNIQLQAVSLKLGSVPVGAFNIRNVSKACRLPSNLEPLYIICVGYPAEPTITERGEEEKGTGRTDNTKAKRAVLIIASNNFRDEELFETKFVLDEAGVQTVTASTRTGVIKGMLGGSAEARILVKDIVVDNYDAIIFIGGSGAREYFNSGVALDIAREAADKRKVLAAICIAPSVLANAGVLTGVRATSFVSERVRLQRAGAIYTGAPVERDGPIITGREPEAARLFGEVVAGAILGR
ncbi:MAG: DJ-1/PfpI family protein [Planctomycetota bacterium]